jgi:hypothetical protein
VRHVEAKVRVCEKPVVVVFGSKFVIGENRVKVRHLICVYGTSQTLRFAEAVIYN